MIKIIKVLFTIVIILIIVACVAVGVLAFSVIDNEMNEPEYLRNIESMEFDANELLSKGLKDTKETKKVSVVLSEEELSILLKSFALDFNKILSPSGIEIKTAYVDILDNGTIKFYSYFSVFQINSSIKGDFNYELNNKEFKFIVNKISIGKISLAPGLFSSLKINGKDINEYISDELENDDIRVEISNDAAFICMPLESMKESLQTEIDTSEDANLYKTLLSLFLRVDDVFKETDISNSVGLDIDINNFNFNNETDVEIPYSIDFELVKNNVEQLLNDNIIPLTDISKVATYLVKGYGKLNEQDKSLINKLNLSSIGITDNSSYKGIISYDEYTIADVFVNQFKGTFAGLSLTEENWNNILLQNDIVGEMHCFARKENGKYKLSYISVESIYVDINEGKLSFYVTISLNGESLVLNLSALENSKNGLKVSFDVSNIRLGSINLNDDEKRTLLLYLSSSITEEWIIVDSENYKIDIDFKGVFESNSILSIILSLPGIDVEAQFKEGYVLIN